MRAQPMSLCEKGLTSFLEKIAADVRGASPTIATLFTNVLDLQDQLAAVNHDLQGLREALRAVTRPAISGLVDDIAYSGEPSGSSLGGAGQFGQTLSIDTGPEH